MMHLHNLTIKSFKMIFMAVYYVYITAFSNVHGFPSVRDALWPTDMTTPFGYRTPSPIDIDTCETRIVNTTCPMQIVIGQYVPYQTINTGYSLMLINSCPELIYITGSIFGNTKYLFEKLEFYWAKTHSGAASTKIDGVGSAIQIGNYLRNSKYDSKNAKFHRDGYLILNFNVNVEGKTSNPLFSDFGKVLSCLRKPGSIWQTYTPPFYLWYDQWFKTSHFYAYPGSIGQYDCATIIQAPRTLGTYISIPQFQTFQNLSNTYGRPISRISPTYPVNGRPVIEVCGVHQSFPVI